MSLYNARYHGENQTHVVAYESLPEFLAMVRAPRLSRRGNDSEATDSFRQNWTGTKSLSEALNLCEFGWEKGRNLISDKLNLAYSNTKSGPGKTTSLDVAGAYPIVPVAVAGDPMNMWEPNPEEQKTKPVVAFYQRLFFSAIVEPEHIINLGAAILTMVDQLENKGYSTEIYCYLSTKTNFYTVKIKDAGEPLDVNRVAFPLAHPSMFRRLSFKVTESDPRLEFESNYGYAANPRKELIPDNSVVIPTTEMNIRCETLDSACSYVKNLIQQSPWASNLQFE